VEAARPEVDAEHRREPAGGERHEPVHAGEGEHEGDHRQRRRGEGALLVGELERALAVLAERPPSQDEVGTDEDDEIDDRADDEERDVQIRARVLDGVHLERVEVGLRRRAGPREELGKAEKDRHEEDRAGDEDRGERLGATSEDEEPAAARRVADEYEDERTAGGGEDEAEGEHVREERLLGLEDEAQDRRDRADDAGDERRANGRRAHGVPPRRWVASVRTAAGSSASGVPLASWSARR